MCCYEQERHDEQVFEGTGKKAVRRPCLWRLGYWTSRVRGRVRGRARVSSPLDSTDWADES